MIKISKRKNNKTKCSIAVLLLTLIFFVNGTNITFAGENHSSTKKITSKADEYLNIFTKQKEFSGSVLIAEKGKIIFNKSYGMSNYETSTSNKNDTVYQIGSITKQFTAAAILMLEEQGKLKTTDPISKYIPDYPNGGNITLHHLLTHTSGIYDYQEEPDFFAVSRMYTTPIDIINSFKNKPVNFKPGENYLYCNSDYILLGYIVEKVSGIPYENFVTENIFKKCGMTNTYFDTDNCLIPNRANGYQAGTEDVSNADFQDLSWAYAAGAIYSTTSDLYKWDKMLMSNKLISKESWNKMTQPYVNIEGSGTFYGYGLFMKDKQIGNLTKNGIFHGGNTLGFSSNNIILTKDDVEIIMISNLSYSEVDKMCSDLSAIVFNQKYSLPKIPKVIKMMPNSAVNYEGTYSNGNPKEDISITRAGDNIYTDLGGQTKFKLQLCPTFDNKEKSKFILKMDSGLELIFYKDSNGSITKLDIMKDDKIANTFNKSNK